MLLPQDNALNHHGSGGISGFGGFAGNDVGAGPGLPSVTHGYNSLGPGPDAASSSLMASLTSPLMTSPLTATAGGPQIGSQFSHLGQF